MEIRKRNNISETGTGDKTIVFAHGFGCDKSVWDQLAPRFAATHRLVFFDLVGSGGSDLSAYDRQKYSSLQGYADDLLEVLEEIGGGPVVFVGHSVSAMIGLLASNVAPHLFAAQIMLGPSACYVDDEDYVGGFSHADVEDLLATMDANYLGWSRSMAPAIMGAPDRPELGGGLANSFCRTDPDIATHFARATFLSDHRQDLASASIPTLVVQCSDDLLAPVEVGAFIHAAIPSNRLVVVENVGHCPHLSAADASGAAIADFLAQLD